MTQLLPTLIALFALYTAQTSLHSAVLIGNVAIGLLIIARIGKRFDKGEVTRLVTELILLCIGLTYQFAARLGRGMSDWLFSGAHAGLGTVIALTVIGPILAALEQSGKRRTGAAIALCGQCGVIALYNAWSATSSAATVVALIAGSLITLHTMTRPEPKTTKQTPSVDTPSVDTPSVDKNREATGTVLDV